jgi:hypothetical protein
MVEFFGFKYTIEDINYYTSMFLDLEDKLVCRIGINLRNVLFDEINNELEEQINKVETEIMPLTNQFIEGC